VAKLMGRYGMTDLMRTDYLKLPLTQFNTIELKHRLLVLNLRGQDWRARLCLFIYEFIYVFGIAKRLLLKGVSPVKRVGAS
jgi:hypothetical protein